MNALLFVVSHSKKLCKCPYRTVLLKKVPTTWLELLLGCDVMFRTCDDNIKCYAGQASSRSCLSSAFGSLLLWLLLDYSLMTEQSCLRRQRGKKGASMLLLAFWYEHRSRHTKPYRLVVKCYPSLGILALGTLLIC